MATKKKTSAKPAKPATKKPAAKAAAAPKKPSKPAPKPAHKPAPKPSLKKAAAITKPTTKPAAKTAVTKPAAKPATKPTKSPSTKPEAAAKAVSKPVAAKAATAKTPADKASSTKPTTAKSAPVKVEAEKAAPKGITVVTPKPMKRPKAPPAPSIMPPGIGRLLDPKNPLRKPLIPSGPKAAGVRPLGQHGGIEPPPPEPAKTPFNKKELEHFRQLLLHKRAELVGDVRGMEDQALQSGSGSLSNMPSHLAEQGSEAYDQSLSLDLAAADRRIIREIDDALKRIANGTYGICEITGKPIKLERLQELPWARHSIEAARELERYNTRQM